MQKHTLVGTLEVENEQSMLSLYKGINDSDIKQVIHYANADETVRRHTSDPKRFDNEEAFNKWLEKGRSIYTLIDPQGDLAGIIWFGSKEMPDRPFTRPLYRDNYNITFSIRIYGSWRGKHLARRFSTMAFEDYYKSVEYRESSGKGIWLETPVDNIPAVAAYEKFGFRQVSEPDEHNEILMVLDAPQGGELH